MHRTGEWILACRKGGWVNMESTTGLRYISYRPPSDSFHFLLFFLLILFLAWFALSPSITGPNQCGRSGWKNGQPLCHIHLNHFNANIGRESIDTGWAAYFLMDMLFFPPWGCATHVKIDQHPTIFLFTGMYKQIQRWARFRGSSLWAFKAGSSLIYWILDHIFSTTHASLLILPTGAILLHTETDSQNRHGTSYHKKSCATTRSTTLRYLIPMPPRLSKPCIRKPLSKT